MFLEERTLPKRSSDAFSLRQLTSSTVFATRMADLTVSITKTKSSLSCSPHHQMTNSSTAATRSLKRSPSCFCKTEATFTVFSAGVVKGGARYT